MATLTRIRCTQGMQRLEDVLGVLTLFVMLYAGLTLTGTA